MTVHHPDLRPVDVTPEASDPTEAGGILTIDLAAIEANWNALASMTVPVECAAVVKANGYGCGLEPVTRTLFRAGCRTFFVADIAEGRRVRALAPDAVIYVLNGLMPGSAPAFAANYLRPVINSTTELAEWEAFVAIKNWRGGAALHVDTGMNRLGITVEEAVAIAPRLQSENHGFTLLMSHLACAEIPDHPMNDRQIRLFREIRLLYRGVSSSLANSSGIFPVVDLKGRIIQVRPVNKGETVGYGAAFTAARPSRVAVVAVGYADGFLRSASAARGKPAAEVIVAGKRCPLAGRVSMDLLAVDVSDLAEGAARRGDLATLIGDGVNVDDLAAAMGTIGYEVLTNLGRRYHRVYKGE